MDLNQIPNEVTVQHLFALYSAYEIDSECGIIEFMREVVKGGKKITNLHDFPKIERRVKDE